MNAPNPEKGLERFETTIDNIFLVCDLEYEAAEKGSWQDGQQMEPGYPEQATLINAYVGNVNIEGLLDGTVISDIETQFLGSNRET